MTHKLKNCSFKFPIICCYDYGAMKLPLYWQIFSPYTALLETLSVIIVIINSTSQVAMEIFLLFVAGRQLFQLQGSSSVPCSAWNVSNKLINRCLLKS